MDVFSLVAGKEAWVCTPEEARKIWKEQPKHRTKIWLQEEWLRDLTMSTEDTMRIVAKKELEPGYTYKGGEI